MKSIDGEINGVIGGCLYPKHGSYNQMFTNTPQYIPTCHLSPSIILTPSSLLTRNCSLNQQNGSHMFDIEMGGCDIFLGDECVRTLGPITMGFLELYMNFQKNGNLYILKGSKETIREIVNYNCMEYLLKKGHCLKMGDM